MLAGALKYDGIFTLQTKSDGPVRLIVADVSTEGAVRGYAQYDRDRLDAVADATIPGMPAPAPRCPTLIGAGYIAFTVDQGEDTERYQGIVELIGATLAECAQHYFRQSEQIQAGIKLSAARSGAGGAWRAGGLMLQRVPPEGGYTVIADDVEDGWRRAMVLMSTATAGRAGRSRVVAAPPLVPPLPRRGRAGLRDPPGRGALPLLARAHRADPALVPGTRTSRRCARTRSPP